MGTELKIEEGRRVRIRVRLQIKDGDEIEKNVVEYFQGGGSMLPGLEKELSGLAKGDKKDGLIKAENAFGDPQFQLDKPIPRKEFPKEAEFEKGQQFVAKGANGQDVILRVHKVTDDTIECKMLHALADKDIEYDVEVLDVTDPTPPPLPPGVALLDEDDIDLVEDADADAKSDD